MSVGTRRQNIIIAYNFWEYINGKRTFKLDSHRPSICSVFPEKDFIMKKFNENFICLVVGKNGEYFIRKLEPILLIPTGGSQG
jgi:hypothetical protein